MIKRSEHPKKLTGQRNQCPSCLEYFNSNSGFDKPRTGSHTLGKRFCLAVAEIEAKGMKRNAQGFWILPMPVKDVERMSKIRQRSNTVTT